MRTLDATTLPLRGRHLIEASAGTGKTYTIALLFLRLVVEEGLRAEQILVVTFTDAAAAELRDRIRTRLHEALAALDTVSEDAVLASLVASWDPEAARSRLSGALAAFDLAPVSTIHGFCKRALRDNAFESGVPFDAELTTDVGEIELEAAVDLWTRLLHDADPMLISKVPVKSSKTQRSILKVLKKAVGATEVRFVPEVPPEADVTVAKARYEAAWEQLVAAWRREGDEVIELLSDHKSLNRGLYGRAKLLKQAAEMRALVEGTTPASLSTAAKSAVKRFTASYIEEKTNKGKASPPRYRLFDLADDVLDTYAALDVTLKEHTTAVFVQAALQAPEVFAEVKGDDVLVFDDLLSGLRDALRQPLGHALAASLRDKFPAALLDEFQDTDPVQYEIFDRIYQQDARLFLIGDPKQAIYGFRGADLHTYKRARGDVDEVWNMSTNWRSDLGLVKAVQHLFSQGDDPFYDTSIHYQNVGAQHTTSRLRKQGDGVAPMRLRYMESIGSSVSFSSVATQVASDVVELLEEGLEIQTKVGWRPVVPGDIAVLVRAHRQAKRLQRELITRGVPSVRYGRTSVFESAESASLLAVLEAVQEGTPGRLRAALVTPWFGWDAAGMIRTQTDEELLQLWLSRLRSWRRTWDQHGVARMLTAMMRAHEVYARVLGGPEGDRVLTNTRHLIEVLHGAEQAEGLGPLGVVSWLRDQIEHPEKEKKETQLRLETDSKAVQIVTMHSSKGLEYPVVFCPYLGDANGVSSPAVAHADDGTLVVDLSPGDETIKDRAEAELRQEELRLAYVALTRAKHLCVVYWGRFSSVFRDSALAHLLHPADGAYTVLRKGSKKETEDPIMRDAAQAVAAASGGLMEASLVDQERPVARYRPAREARPVMGARAVAREHRQDQRISSFSGLVAGGHGEDGEGHDHDAVDASTVPLDDGVELTLATWPRGAAAGTCYHAIMEDLDFQDLDAPAAKALVDQLLPRFGIPLDHTEAVLRSVAEVCATDIAPGVRLGDVPTHDRADELDFVLPAGKPGGRLSAHGLAQVFREHGGPDLCDRYADRVARLRFEPFMGALKGFVDLVFRAQGRWWLVDYKTNHLGDGIDDYDQAGMWHAMVDHDYILQYHLYTLALHRFLRSRDPKYSYEPHFGGVRYLFVRGMRPEHGERRGVFADRPSEALITALDDLFAGRPAHVEVGP